MGWNFALKSLINFARKMGLLGTTPQQNGLTKMMNRIIMERVRCLFSNANYAKHFWVETIMTVAHLINRNPFIAIGMKTIEEMWSGHPPSMENLRLFGCVVYAHVNHGKPQPKALKCMFLGYPQGVKWFKLCCMEKGQPKVLISRDVVFRESKMYSPMRTPVINIKCWYVMRGFN